MQIGSAGSALSLNQILASTSFGVSQQVRAAQASSNDVQAQARRVAAEAGPNAQVSTQYRYSTGPDGQLVVTGARVTTTERGDGVRNPLAPLGANTAEEDNNQLQQQFAPRRGPQSFGEINRPRPILSPTDEARLFGVDTEEGAALEALYTSEEFREESFGSVDNLNRNRNQLTDFGIRAQENQHFRASGGLGSLPQYSYQTGPDGELYAIAGSVGISSGPTTDPEQAARNATTIANAALAATDVSAQDISVARDAQSRAAYLYAANNNLVDAQRPAITMAA